MQEGKGSNEISAFGWSCVQKFPLDRLNWAYLVINIPLSQVSSFRSSTTKAVGTGGRENKLKYSVLTYPMSMESMFVLLHCSRQAL